MKTVPGAWPIDELRGAEVSACFKFIRAASWSGSSVMSFRKCSWPRRVGLLVRAGSRDCCGHPPTSGAASRPHRSALWPRVAVRGGGVAGSVRNGLENSRRLATTAARSSSSASPVRPHSALGYRPPAPEAWQPRVFAEAEPKRTHGAGLLEVTLPSTWYQPGC